MRITILAIAAAISLGAVSMASAAPINGAAINDTASPLTQKVWWHHWHHHCWWRHGYRHCW
jgi:hypothetical protein